MIEATVRTSFRTGIQHIGYQPFNRLASTQNATYTFDANGSMTSRSDGNGDMFFNHDSDGRLWSAYNDQFEFNEYRYDALGRRIYSQNPSQLPFEYTYDGHDVLTSYFGGQSTKYQNGPRIDNKLSAHFAGSSGQTYFLRDHLGTTHLNVDSSGTPSPAARPDSFGNPDGDFTGREYDSFTGLYYYRARMYDPNLGRFISEDPIGFGGGDVNLYGYVKNNPTNFLDPFGLDEYAMIERLSNRQPSNRSLSELLDELQLQLGIIGMIPVVGEPFDAVDGAISLGRRLHRRGFKRQFNVSVCRLGRRHYKNL